MQRFAAQIEEPVFQAGFFWIFLFTSNGQRQLFRLAEHNDIARENFDLTRGQICVHRGGTARLYIAINGDNAFKAQCFEDWQGGAVAIGDNLRHAVVIAQIDEQNAAMVALTMDPAR